jgi:hypothetical protein
MLRLDARDVGGHIGAHLGGDGFAVDGVSSHRETFLPRIRCVATMS